MTCFMCAKNILQHNTKWLRVSKRGSAYVHCVFASCVQNVFRHSKVSQRQTTGTQIHFQTMFVLWYVMNLCSGGNTLGFQKKV